jgi:hypothetical protein
MAHVTLDLLILSVHLMLSNILSMLAMTCLSQPLLVVYLYCYFGNPTLFHFQPNPQEAAFPLVSDSLHAL